MVATATTAATISKDSADSGKLSISQLIAAHPRERLFIHPLLWTRRHLCLLGCQFFDLGVITIAPSPPPPSTPDSVLAISDDGVGDEDDTTEAQRYLANLNSDTNVARRLATCQVPVTKGHAMSLLLKQLKCYG
ncbi:hypothetical protein B0T24DRAFT_389259 [Lasiosphaeria ovina]|uniref:Uncharacterized protein n=1 Tax=Lasiosphaeria ovina TaxID=92902 RepID=A0AAE0N224_9PEZI|nr:hypothetical protein B0T24DRAFT_389259 [Lasiosphaeria ovina]